MQAVTQTLKMSQKKSIAVVGIGCRLPGNANHPDQLWRNLLDGKDSVVQVPEDRWNLKSFYHKNEQVARMSYSKWGGFIEDIDQFDPQVFGITPREAHHMDPQQRLMLEVSQNAFLNAGYDPKEFSGKSVGVFVGVSTFDYQTKTINPYDIEDADTYSATGTSLSIVANRISYIFNLLGPSLITDTACSSSLLALHLAAESIHRGESQFAIAGGVNAILEPYNNISFSKMGLLSKHGRCKAFSNDAGGFVRGEGAGAVLLKPLDQAIKDNDRIYAIIRASGSNQDGKTNGIAVPNQLSQESLLQQVYTEAGLDPGLIDYVEAHGTGTIVGDQIETNSIGHVIGQAKTRKKQCLIGSIKTNIGHLEAGSGIAGFIKACLISYKKEIPANLHFEEPSEVINFKKLKLKVVAKNTKSKNLEWVSVNSFGFGGTNVHAVIQSPLSVKDLLQKNELELPILPFTLKDKERLPIYAEGMQEYLKTTKEDPQNIAKTLSQQLKAKEFEACIIGKDKAQWNAVFQTVKEEGESTNFITNEEGQTVEKIAFVFSGQGPQWYGMGMQLYQENKVFRSHLDDCDRIIKKIAGWSIVEALSQSESESKINNTRYAQPAITVLQIALAKTLIHFGIMPEGVIGHSIGEIAAGHIAGAYGLETALKIIVNRGATMADHSLGGRMIAISMPQNDMYKITHANSNGLVMNLAALNSPISFAFAGDEAAIDRVAEKCTELKYRHTKLRVEHAFHSALMDPVEVHLKKSLKGIRTQTPKIKMMSTVTANWVDKKTKLNADYWWQNVRRPVKFYPGVIKMISKDNFDTFIEIAPHPVLLTSLSAIGRTEADKEIKCIETLYRKKDESNALARTVGKLYVRNYPLAWNKIFPGKRSVLDLPSYPFNKTTYWNESHENRLIRLNEVPYLMLGGTMFAHPKQYQNFLDIHRFPFIEDHEFRGQMLFPATGYLEMYLDIAKDNLPHQLDVQIEDIQFLRALTIKKDEGHVQSLVTLNEQTSEITFHARHRANKSDWILHSTARFSSLPPGGYQNDEPLSEIRKKFGPSKSGELFSYFVGMTQIKFGPRFQGIKQYWTEENEVLAEIEGSELLLMEEFLVHPALMDLSLQASSINRPPALTKENARYTLVPVRIGKLVYSGKKTSRNITIHAIKKRDSFRNSLFDTYIYNDQDELLLYMQDVELYGLEMPGNSNGLLFDDWVYYNFWKPAQEKTNYPIFSFIKSKLNKGYINLINQYIVDQFWSEVINYSPQKDNWKSISKQQVNKIGQSIFGDSSNKIGALTKSAYNAKITQDGRSIKIAKNWNPIPLEKVLRKHPNQYQLINFIENNLAGNYLGIEFIPMYKNLVIPNISKIIKEYILADSTNPSGNFLEILSPESEPILPSVRTIFDEKGTIWLGAGSQQQATLLRGQYANNKQIQVHVLNQLANHIPDHITCVINSAPHWFGKQPFSNKLLNNIQSKINAPTVWLNILPKTLELWELLLIENDKLWEHADQANKAIILNQDQAEAYYKSINLKRVNKSEIRTLNSCFIQVVHLKAKRGTKVAAAPATSVVDTTNQTYYLKNTTTKIAMSLLANGDESESITFHSFGELNNTKDEKEKSLIFEIPKIKKKLSFEEAIKFWYNQIEQFRTLVKALEKEWQKCYILTTGATNTSAHDNSLDVLSGAFPGMIQALKTEIYHTPIHWIDLDPLDTAVSNSNHIKQIISSHPEESDAAVRSGQLLFRRLKKGSLLGPETIFEDLKYQIEPTAQFFLDMGLGNTIDSLLWKGRSEASLLADHVEVKVQSAALNFRDVLKVLGLYPADSNDYLYLGDECAGVVTRVGSNVKNFKVGDEVFGFVESGFASHVSTPESQLFLKPNQFSFDEAASIPVVFTTAYYALTQVAQLQAGETILIHAGAGGVGLAAIQIAKSIGATIITTASQTKRNLLKGLGVDHVFDSRSKDFVHEAMKVTNGKGCDVILNSLAGEFQEGSMGIMAPFGRFVEIGKRDIYEDRKTGLYKFKANASFHIVDLSALMTMGSHRVQSMANELFAKFNRHNGYYPICHKVFPASDIKSAFKYMSRGNHIGKVIVSFTEAPQDIKHEVPAVKTIGKGKTYIISGGTKGLGAEFAKFLVLQDASHVVLISRSGASEEFRETIKSHMKTESFHAKILAYATDVGDKKALEKTINKVRKTCPPIKGVIHAANIYRDQLLHDIDEESFTSLCTTKAKGAWNLHQLTRKNKLDFFIMTSSMSSVMGNSGQVSYAMANSFLDQLAWYRNSKGLPATSINFGPIQDAGFVHRNQDIANRMARIGVELLPSRLAIQLTEFARNSQIPQIIGMRINFTEWLKITGKTEPPPLFEDIIIEKNDSDDSMQLDQLIAKIKGLDKNEAIELVVGQVKKVTAKILGVVPSQIEESDLFQNIGLDSLMAVEMQYKIERMFDISISPLEVTKDPSILGLAMVVTNQIRNDT